MAREPRSSPAVGRGKAGDNVSDSAIRNSLAVEILIQEKMAGLREERKRARKRAEGNGVNLSDLDALFKMRDKTDTEILSFFQGRMRTFGAFFQNLKVFFEPKTGQTDMWAVPNDQRAMISHMGMMAGLKGEKAAPPPTYTQDEVQIWMEAFHSAAEERKAANMEILNEALVATDGKVVDGTPGAVTERAMQRVAEVREQAAGEFEEDNPDVVAARNAAMAGEEVTGDSSGEALEEFDPEKQAAALVANGFAGDKAKPKEAFKNTTGPKNSRNSKG